MASYSGRRRVDRLHFFVKGRAGMRDNLAEDHFRLVGTTEQCCTTGNSAPREAILALHLNFSAGDQHA